MVFGESMYTQKGCREGWREGGRGHSRQREAAAVAGKAEVARSACTNRTMEAPPTKGRDPWDARRACQPGRSWLNSLQSRQQSPHASGNAAAGSKAAGQQHGRGVGGEMDGREGETEPKEGGGVWDKACWAVRSSPQHRQRRPQRQSAAASKCQRPARQSSSKRQLAVAAQASAAARQRRRRRRQQRRR